MTRRECRISTAVNANPSRPSQTSRRHSVTSRTVSYRRFLKEYQEIQLQYEAFPRDVLHMIQHCTARRSLSFWQAVRFMSSPASHSTKCITHNATRQGRSSGINSCASSIARYRFTVARWPLRRRRGRRLRLRQRRQRRRGIDVAYPRERRHRGSR
jgi:hypothetical protein